MSMCLPPSPKSTIPAASRLPTSPWRLDLSRPVDTHPTLSCTTPSPHAVCQDAHTLGALLLLFSLLLMPGVPLPAHTLFHPRKSFKIQTAQLPQGVPAYPGLSPVLHPAPSVLPFTAASVCRCHLVTWLVLSGLRDRTCPLQPWSLHRRAWHRCCHSPRCWFSGNLKEGFALCLSHPPAPLLFLIFPFLCISVFRLFLCPSQLSKPPSFLSLSSPFLALSSNPLQCMGENSLLTFVLFLMACTVRRPDGADLEQCPTAVDSHFRGHPTAVVGSGLS